MAITGVWMYHDEGKGGQWGLLGVCGYYRGVDVSRRRRAGYEGRPGRKEGRKEGQEGRKARKEGGKAGRKAR